MKQLLIGILLCLSQSLADKVRYDNYTLFSLTPKDNAAVAVLKTMEESYFVGYNFWSPVTSPGVPVQVMVPPNLRSYVSNITKSVHMDSKILMENVQEQIDKEGFRPESRAGTFGWTNYHTLDEIYAWLRTLPGRFPGVVTLIQGGTSYEGRPILGVKVTFRQTNKYNSVFLEANIHAREWITSAVSTYILNELLTSTDPQIRAVAESHDWYIFPVFNPDGFVFSHTNNRMWRKTRVPYSVLCFGADPNRNWGYMWNTGGSSNLPCSDTYHGPRAFSEPSTLSLSNFITSIANDLEAYITLHSFSQMFLLPYGHTTAHLDNYNDMYAVGLKARQSLARRYGTQYVLGNIAETIYIASGGSMDWVKGTYRTPVAFTYELRDTGTFGFLLPAEQIIPTGQETLDSLLTILEESRNYLNQTKRNSV